MWFSVGPTPNKSVVICLKASAMTDISYIFAGISEAFGAELFYARDYTTYMHVRLYAPWS